MTQAGGNLFLLTTSCRYSQMFLQTDEQQRARVIALTGWLQKIASAKDEYSISSLYYIYI